MRSDWLLKAFHPRAQFDLPCPGTAVLAVKLQIAFSDCCGIKHSVTAVILPFCPAFRPDAAINHKMPNMDVLWVQFAG